MVYVTRKEKPRIARGTVVLFMMSDGTVVNINLTTKFVSLKDSQKRTVGAGVNATYEPALKAYSIDSEAMAVAAHRLITAKVPV